MNIETNEVMIRRKARIGQFTMLGAMLIFGAGLLFNFRATQNPGLFSLSLIALLVGFGVAQVGIYYTNKYGRKPRPDQLINTELKGLDSRYSIYHYRTPTSHLLVGPAGVWVLLPRQQGGTISFSKGRWRQKGGNLYLKIFAQEGLGRPEAEVSGEIQNIQKYFQKIMPETEQPPINAALIFTNDKAKIQIDKTEEPPAATIRLGELKDLIRKTAKAKPISQTRAQEIQEAISSAIS